MPSSPSRTRLVVLALAAVLFAALGHAAGAQTRTGTRNESHSIGSQPTGRQSPAFDDALARASTAQAAGHYAEAAAAYNDATTLDPTLPELWANRGLMEHLAADPAAALRSFHRALALQPTLFVPILFTGVDNVALHQPLVAILWLQRALKLQPGNLDALLALARAFTESSRPDQAATTLDRAVTAAPRNSEAWLALATTRLALIDRDGARLASAHPDSVWAQTLYARELLLQGRPHEATDVLRSVAAKSTPSDRATFLSVLNASNSRADLLGAGGLTSEALDQALTPLRPAARADAPSATQTALPPPCPSSPAPSARCSYLAGQPAIAASTAEADLRRDPGAPEALFWAVRSNEQLAADALGTFEQLAPNAPATFDLAGDLLRRRSAPDQALDAYKRALALDPHDPAALLGAAAVYLSTGRPDLALPAAQTALVANPADGRLNLLAGQALLQQNDPSAARPFALAALAAATQPGSSTAALAPSAHGLLGRIESAENNLPAAIADLILALPTDQDGSVSFQLARLFRRSGDSEKAHLYETRARTLVDGRRSRAATALAEVTQPAPESVAAPDPAASPTPAPTTPVPNP